MTHKRTYKKLVIQKLKNNGANQNLITILKGLPLGGKLSQGELMLLVMLLPQKRHKEFLAYKLPFEGWNELWKQSPSIATKNPFWQNMRITGQSFKEKLCILSWMEDISDSEFQEVLALVENQNDCISLLDEVEEISQTICCLEKLSTLKTTIDDWGVVEEMASQFNNCQEIRLRAMTAMKTMAGESKLIGDWFKVYEHCLSGSNDEKFALQEIAKFQLDFDAWMDVYYNTDNYRIGDLALQNMETLKGRLNAWIDMLYIHRKGASHKNVDTLCHLMIRELKGTPGEYCDAFYTAENDTMKVNLLLKMIQ